MALAIAPPGASTWLPALKGAFGSAPRSGVAGWLPASGGPPTVQTQLRRSGLITQNFKVPGVRLVHCFASFLIDAGFRLSGQEGGVQSVISRRRINYFTQEVFSCTLFVGSLSVPLSKLARP